MHTIFFIRLFNKDMTKNIHKKDLKPSQNTYTPDNEWRSYQQILMHYVEAYKWIVLDFSISSNF
jgi:hypothetical protein